MSDPKDRPSKPCPTHPNADPEEGRECPETEPAQEWGERLDSGRGIARGGKQSGDVSGATGQDDG